MHACTYCILFQSKQSKSANSMMLNVDLLVRCICRTGAASIRQDGGWHIALLFPPLQRCNNVFQIRLPQVGHYSIELFTTANICRIPTLFFTVLYLLHVAGRPAHDKFRSLLSAILLLLLTVEIPQPFQLSYLWLKLLAGPKDH